MTKKEIEFRGRGTYGCVFGRPIPCIDSTLDKTEYKGNDVVGKVMYSHSDAEDEWDVTRKISVIDPDQKYLFYPFSQCRVLKEKVLENDQDNKCIKIKTNSNDVFTQLLLPDGEYTLGGYLKKYFGIKNISRINMLQILDKLFKTVKFLIKNKFVHQDIKLDNIVASNKNGIRLVDFGLALPWDSEEFSIPEFYAESEEKYNILLSTIYYVNPPEYRCINEYLSENISYMTNLEINILKKDYAIYNFEISEFKDEVLSNGQKIPMPSDIYRFIKIGIFSPLQIKEFREFLIEFLKNKKTYERIKYLNSIEFYKKSDVYSLGVIMLVTYSFLESSTVEKNNDLTIDYMDLIRKCMHPSPIHRITIEEAVKLIKEMLKKHGAQDMKDIFKVNAKKDKQEKENKESQKEDKDQKSTSPYIFDETPRSASKSSSKISETTTPTPSGPREKIPRILNIKKTYETPKEETKSAKTPKTHTYNTRSKSKQVNE